MRQLYFIFGFIICICSNLSAQESYKRLKVDLQGHSVFEILQMGLAVDHAQYREGYLIHDFSTEEVNLLSTEGFDFEVLIA